MKNALWTFQRGLSRLCSRLMVRGTNSTAACQRVDVSLIAGETKAGMEYLEPYGFTGIAHAGAEGVALFLSGDRSHGIVINMADRRYRLKDLQTGEVALYTDEGDHIVLKRGRVIEVTTDTFVVKAKNKVVLDTPRVDTSGEITAEKSIVSQSEIQDKLGSLSSMRDQYNRHTHPGDSGGSTGQPHQRMR
ncbi:phage baseplate assembly protein V [Candidatus Hamiltonella defensa]|uniref:Phage baseplate protein n=1 Tax=Candidatus Williamhamiltonella defendens TaxID=138072 RepID=A0AAC9YFB5_9ENTR|nr:phage baseplate assembly protein V [Candidatus Hamiltonella defensa]ASV33135.1 phage baseplate protein [Candidatus Hamiltonella defensa]AWK16091.1 phage baseplate protein [Candidatus Hamiltonella defensa]MBK4362257.1 phage baseplate assembly protein V [Candidatus Hamiltonella defensa]